MSLYRKYRPRIFADVYGQDHVISTLENAVEHDKLVHAYLFAGSRGTGKTSVARILAKHVMTLGIEDETLKRQIEQAVDDGNIVDLLEIDAASNRGIDDVRDLIEKIQFSPVVAKAKVYIIDEVHMLTKEAFNALLKTLEEPPAYAYFILATTELNKIPVTVQSRCQCFPFRHIREEDIIRRLQYIADQEHISIDREALRAIAHGSDGGMRDAISLLDQMRSLETITLDDVQERTGATGQEYVEQILEAIDENDQDRLLKSVAQIEDAGVPLDVFTRLLLRSVRNALHKAIEAKEDTNALLHRIDVLLDAIRAIRISPVPGLVLESALLSLCVEADAKKEERGKRREEKEKAPEPKEKKVTEKKANEASEAKEASLIAPDISLDTVNEHWKSILNQTTPASVKMSLKNGRVSDVSDTKVTLSFTSAFHKDNVDDTEASRTIEGILENIFKKQLKLECTLEDSNGSTASDEETHVNLADAAAEIF